MTPPRMSVVIPAWNRARTIVRAVESVISQKRPADEIIVVDDGSEDDTLLMVERLRLSVKCLRQENRGASSARNLGVRECAGDWIAFLDSDDTWDAGHLERMEMAIVGTRASAGLYFSDTRPPIGESPVTLWEQAGFHVEGENLLVRDGAEWALLRYQPMMLQSSVIRKSDYLQVGGLWEALRTREDTHLFLMLSLGRAVCAVPGLGAIMTSADAQSRLTTILGDDSLEYWVCSTMLYRDILDRFENLDLKYRRELKERLGTAFLKLARFAARRRDVPQFSRCALRALALHPSAVSSAIARRLSYFSDVHG